jgi:hypothetical protein
VVVLFALGHRLAAAAEVLATVGSGELYLVLQQVVGQPRPSADLVLVAWPIQMSGFPSGHFRRNDEFSSQLCAEWSALPVRFQLESRQIRTLRGHKQRLGSSPMELILN